MLPTLSTAAMLAMLDELAHAVSPGAHTAVLMDRAGWTPPAPRHPGPPHAADPARLRARAERDDDGNFFVVFEADTTASEPALTLEVHQVGRGLVRKRTLSWQEINGEASIPTCELLPHCRR